MLTVHILNRKARTIFSEDHVHKLEQWIDEMDDDLPPLTAFILPVRKFISGSVICFQVPAYTRICLFWHSQVERVARHFMWHGQYAGELREGEDYRSLSFLTLKDSILQGSSSLQVRSGGP